MSSAIILPALGDIVRDTQHFVQDPNMPQPRFPSSRPPAISRLCLPDPPSLYPALIAIGAGEGIANEMNRAYNARALELRAYYEKSINSAFVALNDFPFPRESEKRILDTFSSLYLTKVKSWIQDGVTAYESRRPTKQMVCATKVANDANPRQSFNADYIPLLEHFFDENPFPTQEEKKVLAKKSGMTYRQIHVWFQNRRNRRKMLKATWGKQSTREPVTLLNTPRVCMRKPATHDKQNSCTPRKVQQADPTIVQRSVQEDYSSQITSRRMIPQTCDNVLDQYTAPPYAFPSPYPPVYPCNPFSLESRSQLFSALQWDRCANRGTPPRSSEADVNELTVQFSLLSVRDTYLKRSQRSYDPTPDSLAATCSITTIPPPAPHPALVKPAAIVSSHSRLSPLPIVRASQSNPKVYTESKASSILISSPIKNDFRRKFSPLPKRYPHRSPPPCRDGTPPASDTSPTLSPCSSVRSLSESFDLGATSLVPCPGSPIHPSLPQP